MPEISAHPTAQALALYGHGKLSEAQAATVVAHLETCADCRTAVASLPPDSFLGKVRAAKPGGTKLPPGPSPVRVAASPNMVGKPAPSAVPPANVPPELANHPKFRIVRELGRGGMGVIYLAEHRVLEKHVALKVISPAVLDNPDALARFHAEVKAAGKLDHQNIARAFDADQAGNLHFLVMEFVEGVTLAQLLERKGTLPTGGACHLISQAALGLQHAFEHGMAHRDIKPQNLMVTPRGLVKVLDFGLARMRSERIAAPRLTQVESFMGTPEYVAPEQATDARTADTRSDIYSLGCTLYALLAGRPPFVEDTMVKMVLAHVEKEPQPLHELRPDLSPELSAVVGKMLAKDPAQRYQTPVEVARALARFVKAGAKGGGVALPPAASAGMGTRIGGDTSRVKGPGPGEAERPAKAPSEEEKGSPFGDLVDAPAAAPVPKKAKRERKEAKPAPAAWWKRPAILGGAGAGVAVLLGLVILWGAGLFRVKTADGSILIVEVNEANTDVFVDGDKVTVTWDKGGKKAEISVKPGTHRVEVKKDGFTVYGEEVEIKDGKRQIMKAKLSQAVPPPPVPGLDTETFFNGKNLAGWDYLPGYWSPKDGAIIGACTLDRSLHTFLCSNKTYKDFDLKFKVRRKDGFGSKAVQFRSTINDHKTFGVAGPYCEIGAPYAAYRPGSLLMEPIAIFKPAQAREAVSEPYKDADFNAFHIRCIGKHVTIKVNGALAIDGDYPDIPDEGIIAWQFNGSRPPTEVTFKDIQFTDLSKRADDGFVPLFNGKDLTGWVVNSGDKNAWQVKGGELVVSGTEEDRFWTQGYLLSEREYSDFILRFEFLQVGRKVASSGIALRAVLGETESDSIPNSSRYPFHLTVWLGEHADKNAARTGSLWWSANTIVQPMLRPDQLADMRKVGEWNTMEVEMRGQSLRFSVNGRDVQNVMLNKTTPPRNPAPGLIRYSGRIGFMKRTGEVRFRKIEIKELPTK